MDWFPRRHVIVLARSSSGRLAYLEKTGIVVPRRIGLPPHSQVIYSWEQVLEIRTISQLRQHLSFQAIRRLISYFEEQGAGSSLRDKHLVVVNGVVSWIRPMANAAPQVIELAHRRTHGFMGQFRLVTLDLIWAYNRLGHCAQVVDLEECRQRLRSP
jgi:DNA-binding transcriptional MerR regulator